MSNIYENINKYKFIRVWWLVKVVLSDSLTAVIRRAVVGPVRDSAVRLGGRGRHHPAAGPPGGTPAQVRAPLRKTLCVFVSFHWTLPLVWFSAPTDCVCSPTPRLTARRSSASESSPSTAATSPGRRYAWSVHHTAHTRHDQLRHQLQLLSDCKVDLFLHFIVITQMFTISKYIYTKS